MEKRGGGRKVRKRKQSEMASDRRKLIASECQCIICNQATAGDNVDVKPVVSESGKRMVSSDFMVALNVFCKYLSGWNRNRLNGDTTDKLENFEWNEDLMNLPAIITDTEAPAVCQECLEALKEIARLERVIQESMKSQTKHFEVLKRSLLKWCLMEDAESSSTCSKSAEKSIWSRVQDQLLKCIKDHDERVGGNGASPSRLPQRQASDVNDLLSLSSQNRRSPRIAGRKAPGEIDKVPASPITSQIVPTADPLVTEIKDEPPDSECDDDLLHDDSDDTYEPDMSNNGNSKKSKLEIDTKTTFLPSSATKIKNRTATGALRSKGGRECYYGTVVYRIQDNLFLFKATVIELSICDQQLLCREPGCSFITKGSDYQAFTSIKSHVLQRHYMEWNYDKKRRQCPVCKSKAKDGNSAGRQFKLHMSLNHLGKPPRVLCETCGKILLSQDLLIHQWTHKNQKEKIASIKADKDVPHQLRRRVAKNRSDPLYPLMFPSEANNILYESPPPPVPKRRKLKVKIIKEKVKIPKKKGNNGNEEESQVPVNNLVYVLSEALLLYKSTPIKVSGNFTKMNCDDSQCPGFTTSSDLGIDQFSVFQQMKDHIDSCHSNQEDPEEKTDDAIKKEPCSISCPLCSDLFSNRFKLRSHIFLTHTLSPIICESCLKPLKVAYSYRQHIWSHKSDPEKKSDEQGPPLAHTYKTIRKQINDSFLLLEEQHLLLHLFTFVNYSKSEETNEFTCQEENCSYQISGTGYQSFQELKTHVETHLIENEYIEKSRSCPICPSTHFRDGRYLRKHMVQSHSNLCVCPYCSQSVWYHLDNRYLEAHIKQHHPDSGYIPKIREKLKIYKQEKKWACQTCGKKYVAHLQLRNHQQTHLPKHLRIKLDCPHCPDKFLSRKAVLNHVERKHRPELQTLIECPHCQKKFNKRDTTRFQGHLRSHTNEKDFVCEICGAGFYSNNSLKCHMDCVHVEERIQCEFCERTYKTRKQLQRHQKDSHPEMVGS